MAYKWGVVNEATGEKRMVEEHELVSLCCPCGKPASGPLGGDGLYHCACGWKGSPGDFVEEVQGGEVAN